VEDGVATDVRDAYGDPPGAGTASRRWSEGGWIARVWAVNECPSHGPQIVKPNGTYARCPAPTVPRGSYDGGALMPRATDTQGDAVALAVRAFDELTEMMRARGFGRRVGFGERPAVVVVDLIRAFTDPRFPSAVDDRAMVAAARALLDAARERGLPTVLVGSAYEPARRDAGVWERKLSHDGMDEGGEGVEFDERLGRCADDMVVWKKYPSAFFGTDLASRLVAQRVDTVLIAGASTSGCIRASAVDACSSGFRTAVVREAVADRSPLPHIANLFDIEMKYADVVELPAALAYLGGAAAPNGA
jgi:maleamate amidohydrolase